jgi:hypothetical protein
MTVEKEIEKMMRLAELTVETGTERDCRLGEATGLVVAGRRIGDRSLRQYRKRGWLSPVVRQPCSQRY